MSKKTKRTPKLRHRRKRKPPRPAPVVTQTQVHLLLVTQPGSLDPHPVEDAPVIDQLPPSPELPPPDVFARQHLNPFFADTRFDSSRWSVASLIAAFTCLALLVFAVVLALLGASWLPVSLAALSSLLSGFLAKNFFARHNAATAQSAQARLDLTRLLTAQSANLIADGIADPNARDQAKGAIVTKLIR